jgi:hypothetical protein
MPESSSLPIRILYFPEMKTILSYLLFMVEILSAHAACLPSFGGARGRFFIVPKPMKLHLLLSLAILPLCSATAVILPLSPESVRCPHSCGTIVGGFCTESASGKTQEEARANAENRAYSKYRGSNFRITHVSFSRDSFGYICHLDLEFFK